MKGGKVEGGERVTKEYRPEILKTDEEKQVVYGVVLEPEVEDAQGDLISVEEIAKAAHRFLLKSRVVGDGHRKLAEAEVVESYLAPEDQEVGGQAVRKGSWVMGVHVTSPELWHGIKAGEYTGFSVGGYGVRERT